MNNRAFLFLTVMIFIGLTSIQMNAEELKFEPVTKAKSLSYRYQSSDGRINEVKDGKLTEVKAKNKSKSRTQSKAKPKTMESESMK